MTTTPVAFLSFSVSHRADFGSGSLDLTVCLFDVHRLSCAEVNTEKVSEGEREREREETDT